jgi:HK97 family phage major capsid protein
MNLEQIRARRAAIGMRMAAIAALIATESRALADAEVQESETLNAEDTALSNTERFLARMEASNLAAQAAAAQPAQARTVNAPAVLTKTTQAQRDGDKFKGQSFARFVIGTALAKIRNTNVENVMEERYGRSRPELVRLAKIWNAKGVAGTLARFQAANEVAGGGTGSGDWGHELVQMDSQYAGDFITLLRDATIFDKLPLREIPANVTIKGQDGTGVAYWVGEHKAIPMSAQDYSSVNLTPLKIGALSAISIELVEDSSPSAEKLVTDSLIADAAELLDTKFLSADAASAGVSPAGMLNGLSQVQSSAGADLNGLLSDTDALVQAFITAKMANGLHWVTLKSIARKIAGFRNLMGQDVFPGINENGGTYDGKPMHTGDNVGAGDLILLNPAEIYKIGDSGLSVDVSTEATLEFASDPTAAGDATPVAQSKQPVSLFQTGQIGIRLFRRINWAKRRTGAVQFIGNTAYVPQIQTA